jgi:hypothetical protein
VTHKLHAFALGMVEDVSAARAHGAVIFETPLGREWSGTAGLIDLLIWVETPLDLALSRKLSGMAKTAANSAGGDPHFAGWMSGFLDAYESVIRPSLLLQKDLIKASSDIAILNDGSLEAAQNALLPDLLRKFILVAQP